MCYYLQSKRIGTVDVGSVDEAKLAEMMVGRSIQFNVMKSRKFQAKWL